MKMEIFLILILGFQKKNPPVSISMFLEHYPTIRLLEKNVQ